MSDHISIQIKYGKVPLKIETLTTIFSIFVTLVVVSHTKQILSTSEYCDHKSVTKRNRLSQREWGLLTLIKCDILSQVDESQQQTGRQMDRSSHQVMLFSSVLQNTRHSLSSLTCVCE